MSDYSAFFNRAMNRWRCECGCLNSDAFCGDCGKSREEGEVKEEEVKEETQEIFKKPVETTQANTSVGGSMFATGTSLGQSSSGNFSKPSEEPQSPFSQQNSPFAQQSSIFGSNEPEHKSSQPFMAAKDEEDDLDSISPFKSSGYSASSSFSNDDDDNSSRRPSRSDFMLDSPYDPHYVSGMGYSFEDSRRRKLSNRLSLISVILKYGIGGIVTGTFVLINVLVYSDPTNMDLGNFFMSYLIIAILGGASTAGIILMIVARVKDKTAPFAKVLMFLYIGEVVLSAVLGFLGFIIGVSLATGI